MSNIEPKVILVDENDNVLGEAFKLAAHERGLCHRAFSIFILRNTAKGPETLLQQRHPDKYHCGNLWTNTCCSHPAPHEDIKTAAQRRLYEEMGIKVELTILGKFHYVAAFDNGLTENEVDYVLIGQLTNEDTIVINPKEVSHYQWVSLFSLPALIQASPAKYTPWLLPALEIVLGQV